MDIELLDQLFERVYLVLALRCPAEQGDIVKHSFFEIALIHKVLERCIAVTLGQLVLFVLHDMLNVDICRDFPAESLIQKLILRCAGKILVASYDVGDAHEVIVNDICEVICRHSVGLDEDLILKLCAVNGNVAVKLVVESYLSLGRHFLSDDIRCACVELCLDLVFGKVTAMSVIAVSFAVCLALSFKTVESFLVAEAVISLTFFNKLLGVFFEHTHSLGLDIRTYRTANVRTLVPVETDVFERFVDDLCCALNVASLVGILDTKNEISALLFCDKVRKQCSPEVSDVHISRR